MPDSETNNIITQDLLTKAYSYEQYLSLIEQLLSKGMATGGHSEGDKLEYSKLNLHRMKRLDKTIELLPEMEVMISDIKRSNQNEKMTWLVITEGWCGDAAQNLPLLNKLSTQLTIEMKLILRDEHLEVMDAFLTNGGRSIPKLIVLRQKDLKVLGTWGPRPAHAQQMLLDFKKNSEMDYKQFSKEVQLWYTKDKTNTQQLELIDSLEDWMNKL
jgi:hypothetical protein